jgi:hypothetical protein
MTTNRTASSILRETLAADRHDPACGCDECETDRIAADREARAEARAERAERLACPSRHPLVDPTR